MNNTDKVFEITSVETWKEREEWIDSTIEELEVGSYLVSEHSTGIHGVGKCTICQQICSELNLEYLSASELLKWKAVIEDAKNKK